MLPFGHTTNSLFMNTRVLLAAAVGGVVAFLFGWLLFGILLMDTMSAYMVPYEGLMKGADMNYGLLFLSNLCLALLLAWLGDRMKVNNALGGLFMAATVGFLFYASVDLGFLSMMNLFTSPQGALVDVLANTVWVAGTGAAVGWMLGRGAPQANA